MLENISHVVFVCRQRANTGELPIGKRYVFCLVLVFYLVLTQETYQLHVAVLSKTIRVESPTRIPTAENAATTPHGKQRGALRPFED